MRYIFLILVTVLGTAQATAKELDCAKVQSIADYDRAYAQKIAHMVCSKTPETLSQCVQNILTEMEVEIIACDSRRLAKSR